MIRTSLKAVGKNAPGTLDELYNSLIAGIESYQDSYWRGANARTVMWHAAQRGQLDLVRRAADVHRTSQSEWDMARATTWAMLAAIEYAAQAPEAPARLAEARQRFAEGLALAERFASPGEMDGDRHALEVWKFDMMAALAEHHAGDPAPLAHAAERIHRFRDTDCAETASIFLATLQAHLGESGAVARTVPTGASVEIEDALVMLAWDGDAKGLIDVVRATGEELETGRVTSLLRNRFPEALREVAGAIMSNWSMVGLLRNTRMASPTFALVLAQDWHARDVTHRHWQALCEAVFAGEGDAVAALDAPAAAAIALGDWPHAASLLDAEDPDDRAKSLLFALTGPLEATAVEQAATYLETAVLAPARTCSLTDLAVDVHRGDKPIIKASLKTAMEGCKAEQGYERRMAYGALAEALVELDRPHDAYRVYKKLSAGNRTYDASIALAIACRYLASDDLGGALAALQAIPDENRRLRSTLNFWLSHDLEGSPVEA